MMATSAARTWWPIDAEAEDAVSGIHDRIEAPGRIAAGRRRCAAIRRLRPAVVLLALSISPAILARAEDAPPLRISALIGQLDNDSYATREQATRRLSESADVAMIEPLAEALGGGSIERSWRAATVLRILAQSNDLATRDATVTALERIVDSPRTELSRQAQHLLRVVAPTRRQRAIALLSMWGGSIKTVKIGDDSMTAIRLESGWKGEEHALAHLTRIDRLGAVHLNHASVTNAGLKTAVNNEDIVQLYLAGSSIDGDGLKHLHALPRLRYLSLQAMHIDDASLANLSGIETLESLGLDDTPIGDDALHHLAGLPNLQVLWLNRTKVTDEGLLRLPPLPELNKLVLTGTSLKGPGLEHLKDYPKLRYLSLQGAPLRDGAMPYLGRAVQIETLGLDGTQVGDSGLKYLKGLEGLKVLWLNDTLVTDAGIEHLESLTSLESLFVPGTKISPEGLRRLKQTLPKCRVVN
ncbi:MAG: hypothetical protein RIC55_22845 [Pirellulaceae bacterium]